MLLASAAARQVVACGPEHEEEAARRLADAAAKRSTKWIVIAGSPKDNHRTFLCDSDECEWRWRREMLQHIFQHTIRVSSQYRSAYAVLSPRVCSDITGSSSDIPQKILGYFDAFDSALSPSLYEHYRLGIGTCPLFDDHTFLFHQVDRRFIKIAWKLLPIENQLVGSKSRCLFVDNIHAFLDTDSMVDSISQPAAFQDALLCIVSAMLEMANEKGLPLILISDCPFLNQACLSHGLEFMLESELSIDHRLVRFSFFQYFID